MNYKHVAIIGIVIIGYTIIAGVFNYKHLDKASRILLFLMLLTFINERIAHYFIDTHNNSNLVYGLFNPIQLLFIAGYYNYSNNAFKGNNIALFIGLTGAVFGFVNYIWIQTPYKMNNFFLLLESLVVIALSLYAFYRLLLEDDSLILTKYCHFWLTSIQLFFWTATFFIWGMYNYMTLTLGVGAAIIHVVLVSVNVVYYIGIGTVFLLYKKMQNING